MRKLALFLLMAGLTLPVLAASNTYKNVSVVDVNCSQKVAANPDAHTRECMLMCEKSGFGIWTADHHFLKFDKEGNAQISQAIKTSQKKDHLRVDVTGEVQGDVLQVKSIKLL
ncbi:MAG: hypothetical protein PHX83_00150 [Acidobacteriia bacterium]|nr:hypothetical protein [Terriglobia bacterium]